MTFVRSDLFQQWTFSTMNTTANFGPKPGFAEGCWRMLKETTWNSLVFHDPSSKTKNKLPESGTSNTQTHLSWDCDIVTWYDCWTYSLPYTGCTGDKTHWTWRRKDDFPQRWFNSWEYPNLHPTEVINPTEMSETWWKSHNSPSTHVPFMFFYYMFSTIHHWNHHLCRRRRVPRVPCSRWASLDIADGLTKFS